MVANLRKSGLPPCILQYGFPKIEIVYAMCVPPIEII